MTTLRSLVGGLLLAIVLAAPARAQDFVPLPDDHALYGAAFALAEAGEWDRAYTMTAKGNHPALVKVITWIRLTKSQPVPPFEEITAFIEANPTWPGMATLRRRAEAAIDDSTDKWLVADWFAAYPPLSGIGKMWLAEAYAVAGDDQVATTLLRDAWVNHNFAYREEKTFYARHHKQLTGDDHIARLDRLLWEGKRGAARRLRRRIDAGYWALAEARIALRAFAGGVDGAIARVPAELRDHPSLWYERLRWRRRKGFDESARKIISALPEDLMKPAAWWHEIHIEIRRTIADGLITEAYEFANDHRQHQPLPVSEAEWLAGWIALSFLNDPDVAYPHFALLHSAVRYPISIARGAYWTGRAAAAVNNPVLARHWFGAAAQFPTTFYGQLALAALGGKELFKLPPPPTPNAGDVAAIDGYELTAVVRALAESGHKKLLRPFVTKLLDVAVTPGQRRLVAAVVAAAGRPEFAVVVARRSARKGTALIKYGYPVIDQPQGSGPGSMVDDALVLAMMRQESGFDQMAVSRAGALGYLQLMPATARTVAKRLGLPYSKARLTNDPDYNLTLGRAFIAKLLDNYDGSYALALAAYNAGPSRVRRWVRLYGDPRKGDIDIIDWIELIPISETRNYVQRVMEAVAIYRYRLGRPALVRGLLLDLQRGITVN